MSKDVKKEIEGLEKTKQALINDGYNVNDDIIKKLQKLINDRKGKK